MLLCEIYCIHLTCFYLKPIGLIHEFETNIVYDIINIRIVKLAIFISASTHICACVWYFQACFGEEYVYNDIHFKGNFVSQVGV